MAMIVTDRREWRWVTLWAIIIVAVVSLPNLYGMALSSPAAEFSGFVIGVEDGHSYLAKMEQGRAGNWLFRVTYTSEEHPRALFFPYYLLLGHLAQAANLDSRLVMSLSRVLTVFFELFTFYAFTAYFTASVTIRRVAFLLFGWTSGLGWLWLLLGRPELPIDFWVPDASFFLSAISTPHMPLGQALGLWFIIFGVEFLDHGRWRNGLLAAATGLLMALLQPYRLGMLALPGLYFLWQVYRRHQKFWPGALRLMAIVLPAVPYLLYGAWVFYTNPAFIGWRMQNSTLTPGPGLLVLGFGLIIPLAMVGLWQSAPAGLQHRVILVIWLVSVPIFVYLPIDIQRRFLHGYQVPLAIMGAVGLVCLTTKITSQTRRTVAMGGVIILMAASNLFLLVGSLLTVSTRTEPIFIVSPRPAEIDWLTAHAPGAVVLSAYRTGNVLPAYAPVRVFVGHPVETVQSEEKQQLTARFFTAAATDEWRRQLLAEYRIDLVFFGPHEQALGDFSPAAAPYLRRVFDNNTVQIYAVEHH
jgi:hypothetical protein